MNTPKTRNQQIQEAILYSNWIEGEDSFEALVDSLKAWDEFTTRASYSGLDNPAILGAHYQLMVNLNPTIAGRYRTCNVTVGGRYCPDHSRVEELMEDWILEHADADTPGEIRAAHIAFEMIHPFQDGNGRVGRMIMWWQEIKAGLPVTVIHVGEEQQAYYGWFVEDDRQALYAKLAAAFPSFNHTRKETAE